MYMSIRFIYSSTHECKHVCLSHDKMYAYMLVSIESMDRRDEIGICNISGIPGP